LFIFSTVLPDRLHSANNQRHSRCATLLVGRRRPKSVFLYSCELLWVRVGCPRDWYPHHAAQLSGICVASHPAASLSVGTGAGIPRRLPDRVGCTDWWPPKPACGASASLEVRDRPASAEL